MDEIWKSNAALYQFLWFN